ncbi:hypothetical protein NUACC21_61430 [Scytonema sp. NUACC21]
MTRKLEPNQTKYLTDVTTALGRISPIAPIPNAPEKKNNPNMTNPCSASLKNFFTILKEV